MCVCVPAELVSCRCTYNGTPPAALTSWSDTSIAATLPNDFTGGNAIVTVNNVPSNGQLISVIDTATSLLLHGDGTNGSTTFTDSSTNIAKTVGKSGGVAISTAHSQFGGASVSFDGAGYSYLYASPVPDLALDPSGSTTVHDFTIDFWVNPTAVNSSLDQFLFDSLPAGATDYTHGLALMITANSGGALRFYAGNSGTYGNPSSGKLKQGQWNQPIPKSGFRWLLFLAQMFFQLFHSKVIQNPFFP